MTESQKVADADEIRRILSSESGFSAELKALENFLRLQVEVQPNVYYLDKEEKKPREIDFIVRISTGEFEYSDKINSIFEFIVACDVKSSTAPTVVLSSPLSAAERIPKLQNFAYYTTEKANKKHPNISEWSKLVNSKLFSERIGRVVLRISSKSDKQDRNRVDEKTFREALFTSTKASEYFLDIEQKECLSGLKTLFENFSIYGAVAVPLVIVDGPLYEYRYENGGEKLEAVDIIAVRFTTASLKTPDDTVNEVISTNDFVVLCHMTAIGKFVEVSRAWLKQHAAEGLKSLIGKSTKVVPPPGVKF